MNMRINTFTNAVNLTIAKICRKVALRLRAMVWHKGRNAAMGVLI